MDVNATVVRFLERISTMLFVIGAVDWIYGAVGRSRPYLVEGIEAGFLKLFAQNRATAWARAPALILKPYANAIGRFTGTFVNGVESRREMLTDDPATWGSPRQWPGYMNLLGWSLSLLLGGPPASIYTGLALLLPDTGLAYLLVLASRRRPFIDPLLIGAGILALAFIGALWAAWTDEDSWSKPAGEKLEVVFSASLVFAVYLPFTVAATIILVIPLVLLILFAILLVAVIVPLVLVMSISASIVFALQLNAEAHGEPGALTAGLFYFGGLSLLISGVCEILLN